MSPHQVTKDFEKALCDFTGAPFAVTTTSCTMALQLAVAWHLHGKHGTDPYTRPGGLGESVDEVEIPRRTYCGVPMAIIHAGGWPTFRDDVWWGSYQLSPLPVWDSARWFTSGIWNKHETYQEDVRSPQGPALPFVCVSFHWSKTLGVQQGGAILHADPEADRWLRMARFDGRQEGVHPKDQKEWIIGHHAYMSPEVAAAGLVRLANLPRHNEPLPWGPGTDSDYPDLSQLEIFR